MKPYFERDGITIYHGDCLEVLPALSPVQVVITDPPYGETQLEWDRWVPAWPGAIPTWGGSQQLWCFGSMRMYFAYLNDFDSWRFGQDLVWEKQDGSSFVTDRFRRVHEHAVQWYRGPWAGLRKEVPRVGIQAPDKSVRRRALAANQHGERGESQYVDDGLRLTRSVIRIANMHGSAVHPTEKPVGIIYPLIEYATRPTEVILDPFMGSGTTLRAAYDLGRKAIGIEISEEYCHLAATRLSQQPLPFDVAPHVIPSEEHRALL